MQVTVPDTLPAELVQQPGLLSMCAGDFVEVYSAPDQAHSFDCVATCFFVDTAHNILEYMDIVHHILKVRAMHLHSTWLLLLHIVCTAHLVTMFAPGINCPQQN